MNKFLPALFLGAIWAAPIAAAAEKNEKLSLDQSSLGDDVISVYGAACEKIKADEPKSSLRVRVTDKASYVAISTLPDLVNVKKDMNEHDYNVMIYNLVDDHLEDMAVRTTKQNEQELCVEVTGYISEKNLFSAIESTLDRIAHPDVGEENPETESPVTEENPAPQAETVATPADSLIESEQSPAEEAVQSELQMPADIPAEAQPEADEKAVFPDIQPQQEPAGEQTDNADKAYVRAKEAQKGLIYIAPTEFYNNTSSRKQAENLKNLFAGNDFFYITDKPELADYVIRSKVLRAKVDPINSNTNRMQMVVSVERERRDDHEKATEHQNRFMLFTSQDDEQAVAGKLLKQLLEKAGEKIMRDIEKQERKKLSDSPLPSVITPAAGGAKADAR